MTIRTRRAGLSSIRSEDNVLRFRRAHARAMHLAAEAGSHQAEKELRHIQASRAGGTWAPNTAATARRKGHSIPMVDEGTLLGGIERRTLALGRNESARGVGWFDKPHPSFPGGLACLAAIHDGLSAYDSFDNGRGQVIPARPWISLLAYDEAAHRRIFDRMESVYLTIISYRAPAKRGPTDFHAGAAGAMSELFG